MSITTPPIDPGPVPPDPTPDFTWQETVPVPRAAMESLEVVRDAWMLNGDQHLAVTAVGAFLREAAERQHEATLRLLRAIETAGPYTAADMREDIRSALRCADDQARAELHAKLEQAITAALFAAAADGTDAAVAVTYAVRTVLEAGIE